MNIISKILTLFGFFIVFGGNLGTLYCIFAAQYAARHAETQGIGIIGQMMGNIYLLSFFNIFGCFVLAVGIILLFITSKSNKTN